LEFFLLTQLPSSKGKEKQTQRTKTDDKPRAKSDRTLDPEPICPELGVNYPPPPNLYYKYPPPNTQTLNRIMMAIKAIPKLYTQVLHLMNKMNLPPPFVSKSKTEKPIKEATEQNKEIMVSLFRRRRYEILTTIESEEEEEETEKG
jgi:U11/U12 small nuclear ribonucleoprotein SNRNP65